MSTEYQSNQDQESIEYERIEEDGLAVHAAANRLAEEYVSRLFLDAEAHQNPVGRHLCAQQTISNNLRLKAGPDQWLSSDTTSDLAEVR